MCILFTEQTVNRLFNFPASHLSDGDTDACISKLDLVVIAFGKCSEHRAGGRVGECRFEMTPVCKVIYVVMYISVESQTL